MKKRVLIPLILSCILALAGCSAQRPVSGDGSGSKAKPPSFSGVQVLSFSYGEDQELYPEDSPGVKSGGFQNTTQAAVSSGQEAAARAKGECTVQYDSVQVYYDGTADMWKVVFYAEGTAGGSQSVYLDSLGVTRLIVYGE